MTRENFILSLLMRDNLTYDELCAEVTWEFPAKGNLRDHAATARAVRAVRDTLWNGLAVTEPDETVWMTPKGWAVISQQRARTAAAAGQKRGR